MRYLKYGVFLFAMAMLGDCILMIHILWVLKMGGV